MKQPADKLRAWLLHSRPFRETSLLLDFFSAERGRFSAVARGVRSARGNRRALLQPFIPLSVSVVGRTELVTLKEIEAAGPALPLAGEALFSALYVNELLVRLLSGHEAEPYLFQLYETTLGGLLDSEREVSLRLFELQLLDSLGYGVDLSVEAEHGAALDPELRYYLQPQAGLVRWHSGDEMAGSLEAPLFMGGDLLAIALRDFSLPSTRRVAKLLLRQWLGHHLGGKPLKSRELFGGPRR